MTQNLDPKKVVREIDSILSQLKSRLKEKAEFDDIHKKAILLLDVASRKKNHYKDLASYPTSVVIVFDESFSKKKVELPSKQQRWDQRKELGIKLIEALNELKSYYALQVKLQRAK